MENHISRRPDDNVERRNRNSYRSFLRKSLYLFLLHEINNYQKGKMQKFCLLTFLPVKMRVSPVCVDSCFAQCIVCAEKKIL